MNHAACAATVDRAAPWKYHVARILEKRPEIHAVTTYRLAWEDADVASAFRFSPGQFSMIYVPGFGEVAISLSSSSDRSETFTHTIRAVGNVTRALARSQIGDRLLLRGPFGSSWPIAECEGEDVLLAAGGIGLAPLRPLIYSILRRRSDFRQVWLLYGARTPSDRLYSDEYDVWREAGIDVQVTVDFADAAWKGSIGVVPTLVHRLPLDAERTRVFTCGPEIMMRFVVQEALSQRIPKSRISLSMERNMSCALGFCGHCQFGPVFICKDGPVFSYDQLEPYLHVEDL